jgi:MFS family permease
LAASLCRVSVCPDRICSLPYPRGANGSPLCITNRRPGDDGVFSFELLLVTPVAKLLGRYNVYKSIALLSTVLTGIGLVMFGCGISSLVTGYLAISVISLGMALNSSIQIPIVPLVFTHECERFGRDTLLAYFRTVERVGSVLGPLLTAIL